MPDEEVVSLHTADGVRLEGELRTPDDAWAAAVLLHPLPTMGGSMHSIVTAALFDGLPDRGIATLRFNFRGVGRSEGAFGGGRDERHDVVAAIDVLHPVAEGLPFALAGWSFGADTALCVDDPRVEGWFAVAPPLRDEARPDMVAAHDPRPKLLAVPEHDQFRPPESLRPLVEGWVATRVEVVPGADHYLVGRLDRAVSLCTGFLEELAG